jgi:mRNA-degrading endonuclease RelE of RelBE toxin-antitoxin system
MQWNVRLTAQAKKQAQELPDGVQKRLKYLLEEIRNLGPVRTNWPNYGKLKSRPHCHHCHLKKDQPTYVAVWQERNQEIGLIEVRYVGTHEKADYRRIC